MTLAVHSLPCHYWSLPFGGIQPQIATEQPSRGGGGGRGCLVTAGQVLSLSWCLRLQTSFILPCGPCLGATRGCKQCWGPGHVSLLGSGAPGRDRSPMGRARWVWPFYFSGEGDLECPRWGPWEVRNMGALGQPWIQAWPDCVHMRFGPQCLPRKWGHHGPGKAPGQVLLVPGSTSSGSATGILTPSRCGETVRGWGLPLSPRFQPTEQESWRHRALWREMRLRWGGVLEESQDGVGWETLWEGWGWFGLHN